MAAALARARELLPTFTGLVTAGGDVTRANELLRELKVLSTEFPSQTTDEAPSVEETRILREILEHAAFLSVKTSDWKAFERNVGQLQPVYAAAGADPAVAAARQHLTGLLLMHLLAEARLADFHSRVETLSEADRASPYVSFPLQLDRHMMEGSYNQVMLAAAASPSPLYAPFLHALEGTVRDDIADCAAAAYPSLALPEACRMLRLDSPAALAAYIERRGLPWRVDATAGRVGFGAGEKAKPAVDAKGLIASTLHYATELERIV